MASLIVGCGFMGNGIASSILASGKRVYLFDKRGTGYSETVVRKAVVDSVKEFHQEMNIKTEQNVEDLVYVVNDDLEVSFVEPTADGSSNGSPPQIDFIFEAVFEDLEVKCDCFIKLLQKFPNAVICSNTSSLSLTKMKDRIRGKGYNTGNLDNLIIAHFVGPALYMPFVEMYSDSELGAVVVNEAKSYLESCHKKVVILRKETAGFLHARLQAVLMQECNGLIQDGVCSAEDIDSTVVYGFGRRYNTIGPMTQADFVGADLLVRTHGNIWPTLVTCQRERRKASESTVCSSEKEDTVCGAEKDTPIDSLSAKLVADNTIGIKTLKGFREWTPELVEQVKNARDTELKRRLKLDFDTGVL